MTRSQAFALCLIATIPTIATATTLAQTSTPESNATTSSSPVAYVYVSRPTHVDGFAASSGGKLTAVPGSPFANISLSHMSVNKKYLFGLDDNGADIDSFSIASNGALKPVAVINASSFDSNHCGTLGPTQIDHTGVTVYDVSPGCNGVSSIQAFQVEEDGKLQFLTNTNAELDIRAPVPSPVTLLGNNAFAYFVCCNAANLDFDPGTGVFKRGSSGKLGDEPPGLAPPIAEDTGTSYIPLVQAADPTDHMAFTLQEFDQLNNDLIGPLVLASYTETGSHGALVTTNTYQNLATTEITHVNAMSISPSGKLLVIGGVSGFQIFHFNGASPITHYTAQLQASDTFLQFGWDNDNHLYALSDGQLRVYTVTPSSLEEVSGSPYSIPEASSLIVQSLN